MTSLKNLLNKIKKFYFKRILQRKYYKKGACLKCGGCCEDIYVFHSGKIIKTQEDFEQLKQTTSYSFYHHIKIIGKDDFGLVFECEKFDKIKRLCKDHKRRPSICRNYPSEEIFKLGANLKDKCGYYFEPIEKFEDVFKKVLKNPPKKFEEL